MARAPRNYRVEWNAIVASRRAGGIEQPLTEHEKYLRRMGNQQRKLEEARTVFNPQIARGHKLREHLTPKRVIGRRRYAVQQKAARRERRQAKWLTDVSQRLSGDTMIRQEERWAAMSPDHRDRIIKARDFAIKHKGMYPWSWYMDEFDLDYDDAEIFGYD